jgi:hypothetical protein
MPYTRKNKRSKNKSRKKGGIGIKNKTLQNLIKSAAVTALASRGAHAIDVPPRDKWKEGKEAAINRYWRERASAPPTPAPVTSQYSELMNSIGEFSNEENYLRQRLLGLSFGNSRNYKEFHKAVILKRISEIDHEKKELQELIKELTIHKEPVNIYDEETYYTPINSQSIK